jgi:hypothetical protein
MSSESFERMSVQELRDVAAAYGVTGVQTMSKADLVTALTRQAGKRVSAKAPAMESLSSTSLSDNKNAATDVQRGPDPGLPIPNRYGRERLVLMVQDPFHLFAYWELSDQAIERARTEVGELGTTVLVLQTENGSEQREVDLRGGNYYLAVAPNAVYEAQIALRDSRGKLFTLLKSNRVSTPAANVSTRTDESWMAVDETFGELLQMAGLPGQLGSSMNRPAESNQRTVAWEWKDTAVKTLSSGSFSSHNLSSSTLQRPGNP